MYVYIYYYYYYYYYNYNYIFRIPYLFLFYLFGLWKKNITSSYRTPSRRPTWSKWPCCATVAWRVSLCALWTSTDLEDEGIFPWIQRISGISRSLSDPIPFFLVKEGLPCRSKVWIWMGTATCRWRKCWKPTITTPSSRTWCNRWTEKSGEKPCEKKHDFAGSHQLIFCQWFLSLSSFYLLELISLGANPPFSDISINGHHSPACRLDPDSKTSFAQDIRRSDITTIFNVLDGDAWRTRGGFLSSRSHGVMVEFCFTILMGRNIDEAAKPIVLQGI